MIRKATIQDIKAVYGLLRKYGTNGNLLLRPLSELYDHVRDFWVYVAENETDVIGCCALQFCWEDLAEIRSLAVEQEHFRKKIGTMLVEEALAEARSFKVTKVFTLTYRPAFFKQFGFYQIERSELPLKIWKDCVICVKFPDCDEIAMMKEMD